MKASLVLHTAREEILVVPVSSQPMDSRVRIETRHWTLFLDHIDARALATALTVAAADVELALREASGRLRGEPPLSPT